MASERAAKSNINNNKTNNVSRKITSINRKKEEEVELSMVLPVGTNPWSAMDVVTPDISNGTVRTSKDRARDSEPLIP